MTEETQKPEAAAEIAAAPTREPAFTINADGSRTRKLVAPIQGHPTAENPHGKIVSITLRKPRYRDIMQNGDPETLVVVQGGYVPQTDMVLIERYIVTLSGIDPGLLEQVDYKDAIALRDAVKSFFN